VRGFFLPDGNDKDVTGTFVTYTPKLCNTDYLHSYGKFTNELRTTTIRRGDDVIEIRKQAVSIRMNGGDVRKVKKLAQRLGVRDSDVIRFAVKSMLSRLGPLYDPEVRGRNLVPVFVESGVELLRFFELDAIRLEAMINEGVDVARRVDRDDIELLALTGGQMPYAALKLSELNRGDEPQDAKELASSLRQYLYEKYVFRSGSEIPPAQEPVRIAVGGGHHD
jgi:hypothetical protein